MIEPPQIQATVIQISQIESECLKDVEVSGDTYTHTKENRNNCTIVLDTIINKGIVKLEILIIQDLEVELLDTKVVLLEETLNQGMDLIFEWRFINLDSNPNTLTFFVDDEEQKNFVTNIPNTCYIWVNDASFKITNFEFLSTPTANHEKGSRALEYGKLLIRFAMAQALIVCYSPTSNTKLISSLIVEELNKNIIQASVENVSQSDYKTLILFNLQKVIQNA
ncbi:MAG: hypothetical protein EZS28_021396 [Streblomastix strix]|uniref:Uncharacterized protein n=1 Tax=Streblomastix strix TaxID=222440 RepID=A0A5J4VKA5_9EUKA|nr:MAG: hypothetical protein EZS28_021396 [Streblomastix strix]